MASNFNTKPHFPFTYGEIVKNDNKRLSDQIVKFSSNKKVQQTASYIFWVVILLGSTAAPADAMPPEAGDFAARLAAENDIIPKIPEGPLIGTTEAGAAAQRNLGVGHNPLNNLQIPGNLGGNRPPFGPGGNPGGGPGMGPGVNYRFPGPPRTPTGEIVNTVVAIGSLGYICLQGY